MDHHCTSSHDLDELEVKLERRVRRHEPREAARAVAPLGGEDELHTLADGKLRWKVQESRARSGARS